MSFRLGPVSGCALLLLALLTTLPSTNHAQERSEEVFDAVPLDSRERLVERLREYLAYEKGRQYEKLYELIYGLDDKKDSKEAYAKARREVEPRRGIIQQFTPKFIFNVTINDGDAPTFKILGIARVLSKGKIIQREMTMSAKLQDGEWYLSQLADSFLHID